MQLRTIRVSVCRSQASFGSPYAHTEQILIQSPHSWVLNHMQNILDEREMLIILAFMKYLKESMTLKNAQNLCPKVIILPNFQFENTFS